MSSKTLMPFSVCPQRPLASSSKGSLRQHVKGPENHQLKGFFFFLGVLLQ